MFYRAMVEDNNDPKEYGRVKLRIEGIHDDISVNELPWAEVAGGTDFGLIDEVGVSSILEKGTMVWCFLNYDDPNYPVVFAVVKGVNDISSVAKSSYTNITTIKTKCGHIIELNNSGGSEKIEVKHKTGSKIVIQPDGTILLDSVSDIVHNTANNYEINAGGNYKVTASRIDLN